MTLTNLGVLLILHSFRFALKGKVGKKIPEPVRSESLEKFFTDSFALSEAEDKTSGPLTHWFPMHPFSTPLKTSENFKVL